MKVLSWLDLMRGLESTACIFYTTVTHPVHPTDTPDISIDLDLLVDLSCTLAPLRVGPSDPCWAQDPDGSIWWGTRLPQGIVSIRFTSTSAGVKADLWGEGAEAAEQLVPLLVGLDDAAPDSPPLVAELSAAYPGFRMGATGRVVDAAITGICRLGVTAFEAGRAWQMLVDAIGDDAPQRRGLRVSPAARRLATMESYDLHVMGVEQRRADMLKRVASHASNLESADIQGFEETLRKLTGIAGLDSALIEHVENIAFGRPNSLSVLDVHTRVAVARVVVEGGYDEDDPAQLETMLEPFVPQRGRLVRLIQTANANR